MKKINFQSFVFALIVLMFVVSSRSSGEANYRAPAGLKTERSSTALTANVIGQTLPFGQAVEATNFPVKEKTLLEPKTRIVALLKPEPSKRIIPEPEVIASAAVLSELESDQDLFSKNISKRWPIASLTKLMTSLVALENFPHGEKITISPEAVATLGQAGGFSVGEVFTALDLVKAALIVSSNDATEALAEFLGRRDFIDLMAAKASELGMLDTSFFDPAGLSVLNQSTIADLKKLVDYILEKQPLIFEITSKRSVTVTEIKSGNEREFLSNNQFAGQPDFIGGKTGYTEEANGNLLSIFKRGNSRFLIIVFGTNDRFTETGKLFNWAIENF